MTTSIFFNETVRSRKWYTKAYAIDLYQSFVRDYISLIAAFRNKHSLTEHAGGQHPFSEFIWNIYWKRRWPDPQTGISGRLSPQIAGQGRHPTDSGFLTQVNDDHSASETLTRKTQFLIASRLIDHQYRNPGATTSLHWYFARRQTHLPALMTAYW